VAAAVAAVETAAASAKAAALEKMAIPAKAAEQVQQIQ
jgi:hypothetical protein